LTRAGALLTDATRLLRQASSSSPRLDAELLLGFALGCSRVELLAHPERFVDADQAAAFRALVQRRAAAEPMAYILGQREFYGRMFKVDRRALIPRPETELLVDLGVAAVDRLRGLHIDPRVLEIGTGSGVVAISLAAERGVTITATDVSIAALQLAQANACALGQHHRMRLVQADLMHALRGPFDLILANLPYVPNLRDLPADVYAFEPHVALFGGQTGTELIQRLLEQAQSRLAPHAEVCVELDEEDQAAPVSDLATRLYPGAEVSVCRDAGGYDRVVRVLV
jgi:release factor glutamine methyltransferase